MLTGHREGRTKDKRKGKVNGRRKSRRKGKRMMLLCVFVFILSNQLNDSCPAPDDLVVADYRRSRDEAFRFPKLGRRH